VLSFDRDGTLRTIEQAEDAARLDALEGVEFYNGMLIPAEMLSGEGTLEEVFARVRRGESEGFEVGGRPGAVLIEHIDWPGMRLTARSSLRRIVDS
jgi:hypothetical protein